MTSTGGEQPDEEDVLRRSVSRNSPQETRREGKKKMGWKEGGRQRGRQWGREGGREEEVMQEHGPLQAPHSFGHSAT